MSDTVELSAVERRLGELAAEIVRGAGGAVSFEEYDRLMAPKRYIAPLSWCAGWGDRLLHKANNDKLCAFAAVRMGLLRQTDGGYEARTRLGESGDEA